MINNVSPEAIPINVYGYFELPSGKIAWFSHSSKNSASQLEGIYINNYDKTSCTLSLYMPVNTFSECLQSGVTLNIIFEYIE